MVDKFIGSFVKIDSDGNNIFQGVFKSIEDGGFLKLTNVTLNDVPYHEREVKIDGNKIQNLQIIPNLQIISDENAFPCVPPPLKPSSSTPVKPKNLTENKASPNNADNNSDKNSLSQNVYFVEKNPPLAKRCGPQSACHRKKLSQFRLTNSGGEYDNDSSATENVSHHKSALPLSRRYHTHHHHQKHQHHHNTSFPIAASHPAKQPINVPHSNSINQSAVNTASSSSLCSTTAHQNHSQKHNYYNYRARNELSWTDFDVNDFPAQEFDFEANLALFDKKSFYQEEDEKEAQKIAANIVTNSKSKNQMLPNDAPPQIIKHQPIKSKFSATSNRQKASPLPSSSNSSLNNNISIRNNNMHDKLVKEHSRLADSSSSPDFSSVPPPDVLKGISSSGAQPEIPPLQSPSSFLAAPSVRSSNSINNDSTATFPAIIPWQFSHGNNSDGTLTEIPCITTDQHFEILRNADEIGFDAARRAENFACQFIRHLQKEEEKKKEKTKTTKKTIFSPHHHNGTTRQMEIEESEQDDEEAAETKAPPHFLFLISDCEAGRLVAAVARQLICTNLGRVTVMREKMDSRHFSQSFARELELLVCCLNDANVSSNFLSHNHKILWLTSSPEIWAELQPLHMIVSGAESIESSFPILDSSEHLHLEEVEKNDATKRAGSGGAVIGAAFSERCSQSNASAIICVNPPSESMLRWNQSVFTVMPSVPPNQLRIFSHTAKHKLFSSITQNRFRAFSRDAKVWLCNPGVPASAVTLVVTASRNKQENNYGSLGESNGADRESTGICLPLLPIIAAAATHYQLCRLRWDVNAVDHDFVDALSRGGFEAFQGDSTVNTNASDMQPLKKFNLEEIIAKLNL